MKLGQYQEYIVSAVETDGLEHQHQGIGSHNAEYPLMCLEMCID